MPVRKVCCSVNSFANTFLKSRLSLSVTMIFLKREVLRASLILHCLSIPFFGYHFAVQPPWSDLWFMAAKSLWTKFLSPISGTREFQSIWNVMLYKWCIKFSSHKRHPFVGIFRSKIWAYSLDCHSNCELSRNLPLAQSKWQPLARSKWPNWCCSCRHRIE